MNAEIPKTLFFLVSVTPQLIEDILATAFEGGINYWCDNIYVKGNSEYVGDYSQVLLRGGTLILAELAMGSHHYYELNLTGILRGLERYFSARLDPNAGWDNCVDFDDAAADAVVQYAIFGDVIYG